MADARAPIVGFDLDSAGGTEFVQGVSLRLTGSGGSSEALGESAMALSIPVVIASDQTAYAVTVSGAVDTELPAAAALGDGVTNPTITSLGAFISGFNGTTWDRIRTANTGRLQVDVITGGGTDTPTNPVNNYQTSAALAAGGEADLTTPEATSKKLAQIECWASVAYRVRIFTVDNAVESTDPVGVGGGAAHESFIFTPAHREYITLGATAGLDAFRVEFINLDDNQAADVYATFHYED
ncbi:hypothetical protein LCGC14_1686180 [marine sediment metagenome]|uniref:Uncharacterized protein n=1 Tax=marine sediment metagenome TaxID=412755 RepID=A0A0F9HM70_9ZZZZ